MTTIREKVEQAIEQIRTCPDQTDCYVEFNGDEFETAHRDYENYWYIQSDPDGESGIFILYGVYKRDADEMVEFRLDDPGIIDTLTNALSDDLENVFAEGAERLAEEELENES